MYKIRNQNYNRQEYIYYKTLKRRGENQTVKKRKKKSNEETNRSTILL
jgi:hypothetical protein